MGIDYTAIDVDGALDSTYFDLNSAQPPDEWRGAFDFVNNEGTIEHLINPINGFQVTHELLKVGGVARHSMPLTGWPHHGFFYPTPKFYAVLLGVNNYELLDAEVRHASVPLDLGNLRYRIIDEAGHETNADKMNVADYWIQFIYRKRNAADFAAPADHIYSDIPGVDDKRNALHHRLNRDFQQYAAQRIK